ncbi:MAG: D-alanine--D-alanine ligase family protein, partial [Dehalococcoidia bacterium]
RRERGPGGEGHPTPQKKLRVAVLFGGRSGEHTVSVISGRSVLRFLDRDRFEVIPVAITRSGAWLTPRETEAALARIKHEQFATIETEGEGLLARPELLRLLQDVDVVFPMLHGYQGEDGTIQGLLELAGVPYVGAGVTGSAIGMDKTVQKALWMQAGLPVVDHVAVLRSEVEEDPRAVARRIEEAFGYPCFVKPSNGGSSVGVSKVRSREDLADALTEAGRWDRKILVERFMSAREIDCAVLGNDDPRCAPLGEVIPTREFYDFMAKYDDTAGTQLIAPASVSEELTRRIHAIAIAAYKAVDCAGLARVDFFLTMDGEPVLNEINTIPGFTNMSMYPRLWELAGLSYPALLTRLIEFGLERHAQTRGAHLQANHGDTEAPR